MEFNKFIVQCNKNFASTLSLLLVRSVFRLSILPSPNSYTHLAKITALSSRKYSTKIIT